jgi:hypothetical protein
MAPICLSPSWLNVRFGSLADIEARLPDVGLPPKAHIPTHEKDVRFVPTADIVTIGNNQLALLMERTFGRNDTARYRLHHAQAFVNCYRK